MYNTLKFEIMVMDIAEKLKIKNAYQLDQLSNELQSAVENALEDYALDNDISDYESNY